MARRVVGRSFPQRAPKRLTTWIGPADQGYVSVATGGTSLINNAVFEEPITVIRTRGHVAVRPTVYSANIDIVGAMGLAVVSREAFDAGVASIPAPFDDADWGGWFVWRSFSFRFQVQGTSDADLLPGGIELEIDSKAMRKITPNEALVTIAQSQVGAFTISSPLRTLFKLS